MSLYFLFSNHVVPGALLLLCAVHDRARDGELPKPFGAQETMSPRRWKLGFFYIAGFWVCFDQTVIVPWGSSVLEVESM